MIGLAIHTSSPELGLALVDLETAVTRCQVWPLGRDLTAYMHDCLSTFLCPYRWQDVAFLALSKGPGGFTGTRIGVVAARTLAQQLSLPLFGISSLAAIAQHHVASQAHTGQQISDTAIALAAQRGETFGAIYRWGSGKLIEVLPEAIYTASDWEGLLSSWPNPYHLISSKGGLANSVSGVLSLATSQWQAGQRPEWFTVLPFYGQHPVR